MVSKMIIFFVTLLHEFKATDEMKKLFFYWRNNKKQSQYSQMQVSVIDLGYNSTH